jgi:hypothetical protein
MQVTDRLGSLALVVRTALIRSQLPDVNQHATIIVDDVKVLNVN